MRENMTKHWKQLSEMRVCMCICVGVRVCVLVCACVCVRVSTFSLFKSGMNGEMMIVRLLPQTVDGL